MTPSRLWPCLLLAVIPGTGGCGGGGSGGGSPWFISTGSMPEPEPRLICTFDSRGEITRGRGDLYHFRMPTTRLWERTGVGGTFTTGGKLSLFYYDVEGFPVSREPAVPGEYSLTGRRHEGWSEMVVDLSFDVDLPNRRAQTWLDLVEWTFDLMDDGERAYPHRVVVQATGQDFEGPGLSGD